MAGKGDGRAESISSGKPRLGVVGSVATIFVGVPLGAIPIKVISIESGLRALPVRTRHGNVA